MRVEILLELAQQAGFTGAVPLNLSALQTVPEVREMCAAGRCGAYGHSWSCPPACGTLQQCQSRMGRYSNGILVQTTGSLEDDFDLEGIAAAERRHKKAFADLTRQARLLHPDCLPLTAGGCTLCRRCTYPEKPCRFPPKRLSSMEAYGLLVSDVCTRSGLPYNHGPRTITYTSCILFD